MLVDLVIVLQPRKALVYRKTGKPCTFGSAKLPLDTPRLEGKRRTHPYLARAPPNSVSQGPNLDTRLTSFLCGRGQVRDTQMVAAGVTGSIPSEAEGGGGCGAGVGSACALCGARWGIGGLVGAVRAGTCCSCSTGTLSKWDTGTRPGKTVDSKSGEYKDMKYIVLAYSLGRQIEGRRQVKHCPVDCNATMKHFIGAYTVVST